jgi:hypothetical protein
MSGKDMDNEFTERMRTILVGTEQDIGDHARMRLRAARLRAIDTLEERVPWYARVPRWVTAGGLATAFAVILSVSLWHNSERGNMPDGQVEDVELMTTTNEQLELYKDLDFYRWLETVDSAG